MPRNCCSVIDSIFTAREKAALKPEIYQIKNGKRGKCRRLFSSFVMTVRKDKLVSKDFTY